MNFDFFYLNASTSIQKKMAFYPTAQLNTKEANKLASQERLPLKPDWAVIEFGGKEKCGMQRPAHLSIALEQIQDPVPIIREGQKASL